VKAALTCERAGAQSPGAPTLDGAMSDALGLAAASQAAEIWREPA
jgi:hypothetical protein